nr:MAG TPA: hypothetical protein [Bacteriophage sp.]
MCRTFSRTTLFCITRMPNKWLSTYYTVVVFTSSCASTCYARRRNPYTSRRGAPS